MKKFFGFLMIVGLFATVACNKPADKPAEGTEATTPAADPNATAPAATDTPKVETKTETPKSH